ncbi:hypothetical protein [Alcaligenes phenolicus]|uniref:hypothetical protein n=1 Tax=Alcaligenes phenolicus TaxID=232846 RepID=UPI002B861E0D|nr:hypothetical protein [Alcaligenes phenolicus]HRO19004.1 hypothetical protein [Alcaligenes phenolicus]HRP14841.1 hypothetical protein [Alcaligenes phenolicus]
MGKISENLYSPGEASEAFSAMDWVLERREIALLSLRPGEVGIDAVVLMDRMHGSGGTGKLKMRMWSPIMIEESIKQEEVADVFPAAKRLCTAETFRRIPHEEWHFVLNAIKRQRPMLAERLDSLVAMRDQLGQLVGHEKRILRLTEQRDALGLTFDIASLDRKIILREADLSCVDTATSVLDLLDHEPLQEQDLIWRDQQAFNGLLRAEEVRSGRFVGPRAREVRVHVYDKKPLETVLGIDLLIFMADFESFLLLQYKSMAPKSDDDGKTWSYLVDAQFRSQIEAMDRAGAAIARQSPSTTHAMKHWRLTDEAFYFKFCETMRPDARDDALVAGITLGHYHLKRFLELPEARGKHGGHRIGYSNCPRYLNNTQFVELAREGWIGCDERGMAFIAEILGAGREHGRAAMFAIVEGSAAKTSYERRKYVK